ncbi:MAG: hypothetical protein Q9166_000660 [cf. Caloplaca sp. 2 TL-2023]
MTAAWFCVSLHNPYSTASVAHDSFLRIHLSHVALIMGTRGLKVWRYKKRYFPIYNGHDSYPGGLGKWSVKTIPTDPEQYQKWLEDNRRMLTTWDAQYDKFLSIKAQNDDENRKDEWGDEYDSVDDHAEDPQRRPSFIHEFYHPSFIAPVNDTMIEWVYTFNLDQEVFSINNEIHYQFDKIPRDDSWYEVRSDMDEAPIVVPTKIPADCLTILIKDKPDTNDGLAEVVISSPSLTNPTIFLVNMSLLPNNNFAFRELAYIILCVAAGGEYLKMIEHDKVNENFAHGFVSDQLKQKRNSRRLSFDDGDNENDLGRQIDTTHVDPCDPLKTRLLEFFTAFMSGSHLDGATPGSAPENPGYWFSGVRIILISRLLEASDLEGGLSRIACYQQQAHQKSFNAILLSIEHVVLVKAFPDGKFEHTHAMPLFEIPHHSSMGINVSQHSTMDEGFENEPVQRWSSSRKRGRDEERHALPANRPAHIRGDPSYTFQALVQFFDAVAEARMPPTKAREGCFPTEIYSLVIDNVLDLPTRNACLEVSRTFRDLCLQNLLVGENMLLLPNEACKRLEGPQDVPEWFVMKDLSTGVQSRVTVRDNNEKRRYLEKGWGNKGLMRVLAGREYNRKSLLPMTVCFRPVE